MESMIFNAMKLIFLLVAIMKPQNLLAITSCSGGTTLAFITIRMPKLFSSFVMQVELIATATMCNWTHKLIFRLLKKN